MLQSPELRPDDTPLETGMVPLLTLTEKNQCQIELMKRMGAETEREQLQWIDAYAQTFSEYINDPASPAAAESRRQLRDQNSRDVALAMIVRFLRGKPNQLATPTDIN